MRYCITVTYQCGLVVWQSPGAPMYELIILSFLMRAPMHGYLITKIINDIIGPFARLSSGRLYPLLVKLEQQGLIVAAAEDAEAPQPSESQAPSADDATGAPHVHERRQRVFHITAAGRERVHELMLDTTANPGDYQRIFWHKVTFLSTLAQDEQLALVDHYLHYCQAHIFHLSHEMEQLARDVEEHQIMSQAHLASTLFTIEHFRSLWRLELEHATALRQRIVAESQGRPTATSHLSGADAASNDAPTL